MFCLGQASAQVPDRANVNILVFTTFGDRVQNATVTLRAIGPDTMFKATGGDAQFPIVPFGLYDLDVELAGFLPRRERVRVYQSSLAIRVGLELASTHSYKPVKLSGSVEPNAKGKSNLWVRLVPLYNSELIDNSVDTSGQFELKGMAPGKYLLCLFQQDKLLAIKSVDLLQGEKIIRIVYKP